MNLRKNLICCVSSPVCHFVALALGFLAVIELIHTKAHYDTETDTHAHVSQFLKKNPDMCDQIEY